MEQAKVIAQQQDKIVELLGIKERVTARGQQWGHGAQGGSGDRSKDGEIMRALLINNGRREGGGGGGGGGRYGEGISDNEDDGGDND